MSEMTNENLKKQKRRKELRCSFFFYLFFLPLLALWIFNYHCEVKGLPVWMTQRLTNYLNSNGFHVQVHHIQGSLKEGLLIKGPVLLEKKSNIRFSADEVVLDLQPLKIFKGAFLPGSIAIRNGTLFVPILPENGEEGRIDRLRIHEINTKISGVPGLIRIENSSAKIGNISLSMNGFVDNFLHLLTERYLSGIWKEEIEKKPGNSPDYGIMELIPFEIRKKFMRSYLNIEEMNMAGSPKCDLKFYIDLNNFNRCSIKANVHLPEFMFNDVKISEIHEQIVLEKGTLKLTDVSFEWGNHSTLTAEGRYSNDGQEFSGKVKGLCDVPDLLNLLDEKIAEEIKKHITFGQEKVKFEGDLKHLSITANRYSSAVILELPEITVDGITMKKVKLQVSADDEKLSGEILHAELMNNGKIAGTFFIDHQGTLNCDISGSMHLTVFQKILSETADSFFKEKVSFARKEEPVEFSGQFKSEHWKKRNISGSAKIKYPHIRINGVEIVNIKTEMDFSPDKIRFHNISAETNDGSSFSGSIVFDLNKKHISAHVISSGIPGRLAKAFDQIWQTDSLTSLAKDISSTNPNEIVETNVNLFADYGARKFYQISGNVVMRDPTYCGIPFRYGAAHFITDSEYRLIIPELILKSDQGIMQLESIYFADPKNPDGGHLHFKLNSSIRGNDLLKIFCPDWKPVLVDFPFPIHVVSQGLFDYSDSDKTKITASVQNGSCTFAGANVTDIDAVLHFKNNEISFKNAEVNFCKGICKADFSYHFNTQKGEFRQKLENAELNDILKEFHVQGFVPAGTGRGKLSFVSNGKFYLDSKEDLMINGSGKMDLNGDELWNIPVLNTFLKSIGEAWPMLGNSIGISKVSCDIEFENEKAVIDDVKSNGTIISLDADGKFLWNTGEYDITFRAELLRETLPFEVLSKILSPISWMLSKSYKGKYIIPTQADEKGKAN